MSIPLTGIIDGSHLYIPEEQGDDEGNYLGKYNFYDDVVGQVPEGWVEMKPEQRSIVIASYYGHNKVLRSYDKTYDDYDCRQTFTAGEQNKGAIQYSFCANTTSSGHWGMFGIWGTTGCIYNIKFSRAVFGWYNPDIYSGGDLGGSYVAKTWYILSFVWNVSGTDYTDPISNTILADNKFRFYCNGVQIGGDRTAFHNGPATWIRHWNRPPGSYHSFYMDSVDYSWADGFYVNRLEDLRQKITQEEIDDYTNDLDGSLINQEEINGIVELEEESSGLLDGSYYYDYTPPTYEDDPGHYLGEFSFYGENDFPIGWIDESSPNCYVEVVAEKDDHNDVLRIADYNGSGHVKTKQVFGDKPSGTIDFYYHNENNNACDIVLRRDEVDVMKFTTGATFWISPFFGLGFPKGVTFYVRFVFTNTTWELWIDGVLRWSGAHSVGPVNNIQCRSWSGGTGQNPIFYIDALDYSWADGWYLDRNKDLKQRIDEEEIEIKDYVLDLDGLIVDEENLDGLIIYTQELEGILIEEEILNA